MSIEDPMDWLDDGEPASLSDAEMKALDLERVGTSARLALYTVVRRAFDEEARSGLTRQALADRIGASRALVSRWLAKPSNMTIETAARLMFAMGRELKVAERRPEPSSTMWSCGHFINAATGTFHVIGTEGQFVADAVMHRFGDVRMLGVYCSNEDISGIYEQVERAGTRSSTLVKGSSGSAPVALRRSPMLHDA
jgi:hypothetical protein